jgi:hypothetical protein
MREEAKRDVAPPGAFGRMCAAIERVVNFSYAVTFIGFGTGGVIVLVLTVLLYGIKDGGALLTDLGVLVISGVFTVIGFWFFRQWQRGRASR